MLIDPTGESGRANFVQANKIRAQSNHNFKFVELVQWAITISCQCVLIKEINLIELKKSGELEMSNT